MKNNALTHPEAIHREAILNLNFPDDDVVMCPNARQNRSKKIHEATRLGNLERKKVKIIFKDEQSIKHTCTTIWAQTKENIILKGRVLVPVHRIMDIVID